MDKLYLTEHLSGFIKKNVVIVLLSFLQARKYNFLDNPSCYRV